VRGLAVDHRLDVEERGGMQPARVAITGRRDLGLF